MTRSLNVAYVLLHFPYLTETFIAEEIQAILSHGIHVQIVSLLKPGPGPAYPLSQELLCYARYAPGLMTFALWKAQLYFLYRSSRVYFDLLVTLLRSPCPKQPLMLFAKRMMIFLKAVAVAYQLKDSGVHLLHSHFAWLSGAAAWICARLLGLPFTVTAHAYDIYASTDLLGLVMGQAAQVVTISEYNRRWMAGMGLRQAESISVIHCGVNLKQFEYQPRMQARRPASGPLRILSVGSLVAKKGHSHLIEACKLLRQQELDFTCTIIGDGIEESRLHEQIALCGLQNQVKLLGARSHPEVVAAYRQHDLFVLASIVTPNGDRDGIPVVMMEAGALGSPLISTQVSGIPELVRHNETGWLVPPGDVVALAESIATLAANPALRIQLGQNARALVEAEFNIETNALELATLFHDVVDSARKA